MRASVSRRGFLKFTAAGVSAAAIPARAIAQKPVAPDEFTVAAPVSIEVNARPIPSFDSRDRARVRFGALEYRSGLILTSRFRGFGGLSGWRLDAKGERFIAVSDKGSWFTGRIVYRGREMTGLDDVEAAPLLGPDGRSPRAAGSTARRSRSMVRWFMSASNASTSSCATISARDLPARAARSWRCRRPRASCPLTRGWKRWSRCRRASRWPAR